MDFAVLEIFRAVAAEHSVTRAAQRLDRVQSNVTTRIRQLEEELGIQLFRRDGKRMTLTAEGERFLHYANRLLALEEEARQAMSPGIPVGTLRIGTMESTAASRLPVPLAQFHGAWPEVALELSVGHTDGLLRRVLAHELDCAFIASPEGRTGGLDPELTGTALFVEQLVMVLPARHPAIVRPGDVQISSFAAFELGCTYRRLGEEWLGRWRTSNRPLKLLELGSYHAILACVAAGTSVGVVPQSVLDLHRPAIDIRTHPLGEVETLLVWRRGYRSAALDAFLAILRAGGPARRLSAE